MKKIFLFAVALAVYQFGFTQGNTIKLKSGELELVVDRQLDRVDNIAYYFMSFSAIPTIENRVKIADLGVAFLEYIPNKTYVVNLDEECENCTKLFDTQFSNAELDVIVQVLVNDSLEYNYQDWNEFITFNFPDLNDTFEECSKYGGMVSVDPLGDTKDFRQVWYSDGSTVLLQPNDSIFEIGTIYYECK